MGGGIYLRLLPFRLFARWTRKVVRKRPFFLYVHPWETDPGTPRLPLPASAAWATYWRRGAMLEKLDRLLRMFRFSTMEETLAAAGFPVRERTVEPPGLPDR